MERQERVREIAQTLYLDSQRRGLANDPERDWREAEAIYNDRGRYYLIWLPLQAVRKEGYKLLGLGACMIILLLALNVRANQISGELRPQILVDMVDPIKIADEDNKNIYYGNYIILRNTGRTPAYDVAITYHMTTDADQENSKYLKWHGGFGLLGYVAPNCVLKEPGFQALSPSAKYYYFEIVSSYESICSHKTYWSHIKRIYKVEDASGALRSVYTYKKWDDNNESGIPTLASCKEVNALLSAIKKGSIKN